MNSIVSFQDGWLQEASERTQPSPHSNGILDLPDMARLGRILLDSSGERSPEILPSIGVARPSAVRAAGIRLFGYPKN